MFQQLCLEIFIHFSCESFKILIRAKAFCSASFCSKATRRNVKARIICTYLLWHKPCKQYIVYQFSDEIVGTKFQYWRNNKIVNVLLVQVLTISDQTKQTKNVDTEKKKVMKVWPKKSKALHKIYFQTCFYIFNIILGIVNFLKLNKKEIK